ncbi:hypothetical protein C9374_000812 [Naegleria lovaniensis]|uniref:Uncharacterized protein n=1 Tax=Naegleria lovaniensis TaxID=51637 RepID=A0AA88GVU1_NAELO|nr:uncharacterized protein C9374_000812 [Naegleria lovaniensis]KAG2387962.1 hypothetical protein C9374_000812 [Naegleria lovaniensis]
MLSRLPASVASVVQNLPPRRALLYSAFIAASITLFAKGGPSTKVEKNQAKSSNVITVEELNERIKEHERK